MGMMCVMTRIRTIASSSKQLEVLSLIMALKESGMEIREALQRGEGGEWYVPNKKYIYCSP